MTYRSGHQKAVSDDGHQTAAALAAHVMNAHLASRVQQNAFMLWQDCMYMFPFIAGPTCQTALELLGNLHVLNMHWAEQGTCCVHAASVSSLFFPTSGPFFWCPATSTPARIAGRFPAVRWTIGNALVMLLRNTMRAVTWSRNSEATCHTWPLNWTFMVFGLSLIPLLPLSVVWKKKKKKQKWNSWEDILTIRCEDSLHQRRSPS